MTPAQVAASSYLITQGLALAGTLVRNPAIVTAFPAYLDVRWIGGAIVGVLDPSDGGWKIGVYAHANTALEQKQESGIDKSALVEKLMYACRNMSDEIITAARHAVQDDVTVVLNLK